MVFTLQLDLCSTIPKKVLGINYQYSMKKYFSIIAASVSIAQQQYFVYHKKIVTKTPLVDCIKILGTLLALTGFLQIRIKFCLQRGPQFENVWSLTIFQFYRRFLQEVHILVQSYWKYSQTWISGTSPSPPFCPTYSVFWFL